MADWEMTDVSDVSELTPIERAEHDEWREEIERAIQSIEDTRYEVESDLTADEMLAELFGENYQDGVQYGGGVSTRSRTAAAAADDRNERGPDEDEAVTHNTNWPSNEFFTVSNVSERRFERFKTVGIQYMMQIKPPSKTQDAENWLHNLFVSIIRYFFKNTSVEVKPSDRVGLTLSNTDLASEPVFISLRRSDQLTAEVILEQIQKIFASNKKFFLNGFLAADFIHIQVPHGRGQRVKRKIGESVSEYIADRTCFIKYAQPPNDQYCLPYALVIGRAFVQRELGEITKKDFINLQDSFKQLRREAVNLCIEAKVDMRCITHGCTGDDVRKFQNVMSNYQIVVYWSLNYRDNPYTDLKFKNNSRRINILCNNEHYYAIRSLTACFAVNFICLECNASAVSAVGHACKYACPYCEQIPKCPVVEEDSTVTCETCNRTFMGNECFSRHLLPPGRGTNTVCKARKKCTKCGTVYKTKTEHHCGVYYCRICEKRRPYEHQCHMPLYKTKRKEDKNVLYVFFDFETQQDTPMGVAEENKPQKYMHVPNLCVLQTACSYCSENSDIAIPCTECGIRQHIFDSYECVDDLMNYLTSKVNERDITVTEGKTSSRYKFSKVIAIAHNMSGFDGQFVLRHILGNDRYPKTNMILNGTKLIFLGIGNRLSFIDSLNYFHEPLSRLPALFGFEDSKGYYCYKFNTALNNNYVGKLPAKKYYAPELMGENQRAAFDKWYDAIPSDYVFDNKKELIDYCVKDVDILRKACLKFAEDFWKCNQIEPFLDACTIADACNKVYRSKYLQPETIGIIPTKGYRFVDNQSRIGLKWLCHVEEELGIEIQHAGRGREVVLKDIGRVDGFFGNTVLEFLGCWYHLHDCIINPYNINDKSAKADEMRNRKERTESKLKAIRKAGYNLITMYECDFRKKLKANPELDAHLESLPFFRVEQLYPRDAFYGGRTNANRFYFKADEETRMFFYDFCSLYPSQNKYAKTILGHPTVHLGEKCANLEWQSLDGLMKVTVLPPRGLAFPVLPTRMHDRLMFILCHSCASTLTQEPCSHSATERMLTGTWVMDEVKLAVSEGYEIIEIHEIWEYKTTQYDPVTRTGGLFAEYINNFVQIKTQANGWPKSCVTSEQKQSFLDEFELREGIKLDATKMQHNPSLRQLAKIQLNSFWGRFGKREDLPRTELITDYSTLVNRIFDHNIDIDSVITINEYNLLLTYKSLEEARIPDKTSNVVIAAFTTAYARMKLYKCLKMLGSDRVWYFDTDSIIFSAKPGDVMPPLGNFLGDLTDELEVYGVGSYIIEFVTGGPKNYAYKVFSTKENKIITKVKVKGISLNSQTIEKLNFDVISLMVTNPNSAEIIDGKIEVVNECIRRTNLGEVYTTTVPKTYRFEYIKRQQTGIDFKTLPYGY